MSLVTKVANLTMTIGKKENRKLRKILQLTDFRFLNTGKQKSFQISENNPHWIAHVKEGN